MRIVRRLLRRTGLPVDGRMWLLMIALTILGGWFSAFIMSDEFRLKSAQAAMRQHLYNKTGRDIPAVVHEGNFKDGFVFSVPYEKIEDGRVTRRGEFSGRAWPDENRVEGRTSEEYNLYGDSGRRSVTTRGDGTVEIKVER